MNVTFTGKIIAAGQVQTGISQNGTQWSSCEYVIEELNQQYPARAVIQVYGSDKLQMQNFPPQVNANGQPIQQQAQYGGQQGNLPFPANN